MAPTARSASRSAGPAARLAPPGAGATSAFVAFLAVALALAFACQAGAADLKKKKKRGELPDGLIAEIRFEGANSIPHDQIKAKMLCRVGRPLDQATIDTDIKTLSAQHWFSSVDAVIDPQPTEKGYILTFRVDEMPKIDKVEFRGRSNAVREKELLDRTQLKPGGRADAVRARLAVHNIKQLYEEKGYELCEVSLLSGDKAGDKDVIFEIFEGPKFQIGWVDFKGNAFATDATLLTKISSKRKALGALAGKYQKDALDEDVRKLIEYYQGQGFADVKVAVVSRPGASLGDLRLEFDVSEGVQYKVRKISFKGNKQIDEKALRADLALHSGQPFTDMLKISDQKKLMTKYWAIGCIDAQIQPTPEYTDEPGVMDIVYEIEEGDPYTIADFIVKGNKHTRDKVIRREALMAGVVPGEVLNKTLVDTYQRRLQQLNYFQMDPQKGKPLDIKIINRRRFDQPYADAPLPDLGGLTTRGQSPEDEDENLSAFRRRLRALNVFRHDPPPKPRPSIAPKPKTGPARPQAAPYSQPHWEQSKPVTTIDGVVPTTARMQSPAPEAPPQQPPAFPEVGAPPSLEDPPQIPAGPGDIPPPGGDTPPAADPAVGPAQAPGLAPFGADAPFRPPVDTIPQVDVNPPPQPGPPATPPRGGLFGRAPRVTDPMKPGGSTQGSVPDGFPNLTGENMTDVGPDRQEPFQNRGYADIVTQVDEAPTGSLLFGVGANSYGGIFGNIIIHERNFDLFNVPGSFADVTNGTAFRGGGQELRIELSPGTQVNRALISFRDPYLFDLPVGLGVSGYGFTRIYHDWTEARAGGRFSLGKQFGTQTYADVAFRIEDVNIYGYHSPAPADLLAASGQTTLATLRPAIRFDNRNNAFNPSKGQYIEAAFEQGWGTFTYPKFTLEARQHFLTGSRPDGSGQRTLTFRSFFGITGRDTPIYERFFAGDFRSMRGFYYRGVGPHELGVNVGGLMTAIGSVEYQFPWTANDAVGQVFFFDFGTVEPDYKFTTFRGAIGTGLRLKIPALGPLPLAFDLAFPIAYAPGDRLRYFTFFIGAFW